MYEKRYGHVRKTYENCKKHVGQMQDNCTTNVGIKQEQIGTKDEQCMETYEQNNTNVFKNTLEN